MLGAQDPVDRGTSTSRPGTSRPGTGRAGADWMAPTAAGPRRTRLEVPGSKSMTNRTLILAAATVARTFPGFRELWRQMLEQPS